MLKIIRVQAALREVITYRFNNLLLKGIDSVKYSENKRSTFYLERLGFRKLEQEEDYFRLVHKRKDRELEKQNG